MEQEQERERQHIRLMMSDAAAGDQFDEFFDNEHAAWVSSDDDQINNIHLTTLPPVTQVAPEEAPPMSKKEKKELEKALKKQKEKEEKEKHEREHKEKEEKERKEKEKHEKEQKE